jgi:CBS domain-containing protein
MALQSGAMLRPLAVMMNRAIRTVGPDATLAEAARLMREAQVGALFIGRGQ